MTQEEKTIFVEGFLKAYRYIFIDMKDKRFSIRRNMVECAIDRLTEWEKTDATELIELPKYLRYGREVKSELV